MVEPTLDSTSNGLTTRTPMPFTDPKKWKLGKGGFEDPRQGMFILEEFS